MLRYFNVTLQNVEEDKKIFNKLNFPKFAHDLEFWP